jgi:hypothetical protein
MTTLNSERDTPKRRPQNARGLVAQIIEKWPTLSTLAQEEKFCDAARRDEDFVDEVLRTYWRQNSALLTKRPATAAERSERNARIVEVAKTMRNIILLDLMLPSGKLVRNSTGAECTKAGGFFAEIGKRIGSRKIVGNVLSEADLQAIWKRLAL